MTDLTEESSPQSFDSSVTLDELQNWLPPIAAEARRLLSKAEQSNRLLNYRPYRKQALFHALGRMWPERLLRAGNQQGKTFAGGMEMAMHLTGIYPPQWPGRKFETQIDAWAACDTGETSRDNPQRVLIGGIGEWGTGCIPSDKIIDFKRGRGVADLLDTVLVRHVSGGVSRLGFKHYAQGREAWQGPSKHAIWCDEEPPSDIYSEAKARLVATDGMIFTTFTPLNGMSDVVSSLLNKPCDVNMTIDDAEHIAPARRAAIIASFPEHEQEARTMGVPMLGGGRVFQLSEASIRCDPFDVPIHWPVLGAMDFGWDHPFAGIKLAWDRDHDKVFVTAEYRIREQTPVVHAAALKPWGNMRWAWPHDGHQHDKGSGITLASQYRAAGIRTFTHHATFPDGGFGLEAGIAMMLDRMKTGRLKVFSTCVDWFDEYRHYHRLNGLIVKQKDDLLSATRVGLMMLRSATAIDAASFAPHTADSNYNPLDGAPSSRDHWDARGGFKTRVEGDYDVLR